MTYPTMTMTELNEKVERGEIWNVSFVSTAKNGTKTFEAFCHCDRCGGSGHYGSFGVCFRCGGSGHEPCKGRVASEEQIQKNAVLAEKRAERKIRKKTEAIETAIAEHPVEGKIVASWLSGAFCGCKVIAIKSETEKAYEVVIEEDENRYTTYIPKKALVDEEKPLLVDAKWSFVDWYKEEFTNGVELVSYDVMRETDKARLCRLHISIDGDKEIWTRWIPKSCFIED